MVSLFGLGGARRRAPQTGSHSLIIGFHPLPFGHAIVVPVEAFPTAYEATALCAAAELAGIRVMITPKLPSALRRGGPVRTRSDGWPFVCVWDTCRRLERLYAALPEPEGPSDADIRATRFASTRHPMIKLLKDPTRGPV